MSLANPIVPQAPAWLTSRPIAHRGLHDVARGIVENSASAARAAVARDFAIECDVQVTADGEAIVFHDSGLERLTGLKGRVADHPSGQLTGLHLAGSADTIPTLAAFLDLVGGRVPVMCEVKSAFDGDTRLADRVAAVSRDYAGPLAIQSFDPEVLLQLRNHALERPLGIISEATFDDPEWDILSACTRRTLIQMLHYGETRPDFLSFGVNDLPHAVPNLFRTGLHLPVTTWTVRTSEERQAAALWADQIVFEGFLP